MAGTKIIKSKYDNVDHKKFFSVIPYYDLVNK